ncbi:MAG TPA: hypothetical protein VGR93_10650 [Candidatus Acidoferrales bacterium]|nr:hypothetical protein [Candidatus Acidoferrales bacterium]
MDLNPKGSAFYPDLVKALVSRYKFQEFPSSPADFDEAKGVRFALGKLGDSAIDQVVIYAYGIVLDTRASTAESRRLLEDALRWAAKELGLVYEASMIKRWQYASQVTFYSNVGLGTDCRAFRNLAENVQKSVQDVMREKLSYELTGLLVDYDQLERKHPLGRFSIQRRDNTPFSENKYFSEAPLPTDVHLRILEQFENELSQKA